MRLVGAPEALVEFNEYVYVADQKINLEQFETQFYNISGGTYIQELPTYEQGNTFNIIGVTYTGFTTEITITDVNVNREEYPMDVYGYPQAPINTENYFFQIGSGWFESTPRHRSPEQVDFTLSVFTGNNPNFQTKLTPFSYGQVYLNRFRNLPYTKLGFSLTPTIDNNKSWIYNEVGVRVNLDGGFNARYFTESDKLVLNVKNIDLFMNPSQGLVYDVWFMSRQYDYPIPNQGMSYIPPTPCNQNPIPIYPTRGGVDWTEINPQPRRKSFFEFAQTFWTNMINVRNRMYASNGKTGGYPTLESIYWRYIESEQELGVQNNNFTYQTMIDFVNGLGDYWIRIVEQMIPTTTLWNTGTRYENSIFHRQKFVWKRQIGCQIIPFEQPTTITNGTPPIQDTSSLASIKKLAPTTRPGKLTTSVFTYDCPIEATTIPKYPWSDSKTISDFKGVLGVSLNNYVLANGLDLNGCDLNNLQTEWFLDLRINSTIVIQYQFFVGNGYNNSFTSSPNKTDWDNALLYALPFMREFGYDFYFINDDLQIVIFNELCVNENTNTNVELNVGINFNLLCS